MSKRYGNLFEQCFTLDNLYYAYLDARKHKRKKPSIQKFEEDLGFNLVKLHQLIHSGNYRPSEYHTFTIHKPKLRVIHAPAFHDRVIQHAIYRIIYPIFDKSFIHDSYGCRKGKGIHSGSLKAQDFLRKSKRTSYSLQIDVKWFYDSIDHKILESLIRKKIKDDQLVNIMMLFVKSTHHNGKGLPVGNLLSQLYGLIYLNLLDHFIKRNLKIKFYTRYVDDCVLFDIESKETAKYILSEIEEFLLNNLNLSLSKFKFLYNDSSRPINFIGYRCTRKTRRLRARSIRNFHKALQNKSYEKLPSFIGHSKQTSNSAMFTKMTENLNFDK